MREESLRRHFRIAIVAGLFLATAIRAGPPFLTDDPQPTDHRHWEVYNFVAGTRVAQDTSGQAGFDINYGGAENLQLTAVVPFGYDEGTGNRDYWQQGAGVTRKLTARLQIGAELFHLGPDADDARSFTVVNLGALWRVSEHWSLIGSAGPGVQHAKDGGCALFYLALKADY